MDDRKNTTAGWILFAGIIALGGWVVSGEAYHAGEVEKGGYALPGGEEGGAGGEAAKPIEFYLASADPVKGEAVFKKCAACHTVDQGGANGIGPNLWSVMGEPIGKGRAGFAFSDALASKGGSWDWKAMDEWLASPRAFAPGTKMTFAGLGSPEDRANLMVYLNKQGSSLPIPAAPAEAAPAEGNAAAPAEGNAAAPAEGNAAAPANTAAPKPE
ncbi:MAG: cytochrome c family protein [Hyphomicrobium sp.]|nr:cytochrome c family protein [Hyphomicrobium sp.]